jgi:hypothetical protein
MMPMTAVAETQKVEPTAVRRFELADISQHGGWLIPRLIRQYPHLNQRTAMGFLNNILYNAEFHFCYAPHAAGLAQLERAHTLNARAIVREKFVWVADSKNPDHLAEAVAFYDDFIEWGRRCDAEAMIVEEASDVPHEMVRQKFDKRIFVREQKFVRLT